MPGASRRIKYPKQPSPPPPFPVTLLVQTSPPTARGAYHMADVADVTTSVGRNRT